MNQSNYRNNQMISSNYAQPELEIYPSPRQIREEMINNNEYNYSNKYNNTNNSNSNIINNENSSLRRYESSDGVLRGYTDNYSFYVSGSSQVRPKVTINSQYNNNVNYNYNQNNQRRYIANTKNAPSPQRVGGQFQKIYYSNNNRNNIGNNRQMSQRNNSYIIKKVMKNNQDIYAP